MKRVSGFTLIELIMVIVILGVLSAFALPRFADLGGDARLASLNALAGTLRSSSNIAHAQQLADGNSGSSSDCRRGRGCCFRADFRLRHLRRGGCHDYHFAV